jgi:hypothetical protein
MLENYIKGYATDDGDYPRNAFPIAARVFSYRDGKRNQMTSETRCPSAFSTVPANVSTRRGGPLANCS